MVGTRDWGRVAGEVDVVVVDVVVVVVFVVVGAAARAARARALGETETHVFFVLVLLFCIWGSSLPTVYVERLVGFYRFWNMGVSFALRRGW